MIDILINQVDEHNESNILATKEFNPETVYFFKDKNSEDKMKALRAYYEKNFRNIKIKEFIIDEGNKDKIERIINSISEKNIIINLTGGKRINSLILLDISNKNKIPSIYIDIKMKMIYEFKESIIASNKNFEDLEIDDIVKA